MASDDVRTSSACLAGWYGGVLCILAILLVAPIWLVDNPPLVDYPNLLARGYVLHHSNDVPTFRDTYEIDFRSTPSLAMDVFLLAAQRVTDVRIAGKLFLSLTILLWLLGWHLLGVAIHGQPTWLALGAALFAYHSMFVYGFANFSFGVGVFLIALAAWYYSRTHWPWPRHLLVAVLALACFFSHLAAFVFLAGRALAVTAWDCFALRKVTCDDVVNLLPILLPLAFLRGGGQSGLAWNWSGKVVGAISLVRGYSTSLDLAFLLALFVFGALLLYWSRPIRAVGNVLFAGLGCVAMFLLGPHELFGGSPADARFLLPASALVTLSLDLTLPRKKAIALLCVFLTLVAIRLGLIAWNWRDLDADLRDQVALMADLPDQARVYSIVKVASSPDQKKRDLASFHAIGYAVIDRRIYTPTMMTIPGHSPLRYKSSRIADHADPEPFKPAAAVDWNQVFANHQYLWTRDLPADYREPVEKNCTLVASKGRTTIWRVRIN